MAGEENVGAGRVRRLGQQPVAREPRCFGQSGSRLVSEPILRDVRNVQCGADRRDLPCLAGRFGTQPVVDGRRDDGQRRRLGVAPGLQEMEKGERVAAARYGRDDGAPPLEAEAFECRL